MSRFLKALLLTAAATGVAAFALEQLDLEGRSPDRETSGAPGPDPGDVPEEDLEMLMKELASHLG